MVFVDFSFFYPSLRYRSHKVYPLLFTNRSHHYFQTPQKPLYFKAFQRFCVLYSHLVNKPPSVFKLVNKLPAYLLRAYGLLVHFLLLSSLCLTTLESVKTLIYQGFSAFSRPSNYNTYMTILVNHSLDRRSFLLYICLS